MKNVILLGDSIRIGYQPFVIENLKGWANVTGPEVNCRHSRFFLENLADWALNTPADIIHVNTGLHDAARVHVEGEDHHKLPKADNQIPFDEYRKNVRAILQTLLEETSAKIIWRTTTPSLLERQIACGKDRKRTPEDIDKYNAAASEIAQSLGLPIHNLYAEIIEMNPHEVMSADGIHYTPEGYAQLAEKVAASIREHA